MSRNHDDVVTYLNWQRDSRGRTASTLHDYAFRLDAYVRFLDRRSCRDVTLDELEAFVARDRRGGVTAKAATKAKDVAVLKSFYSYLTGHQVILWNPTTNLHAPTVANRNPKPVPENTWRRIWSSNKLTDLDRAIFGLGFFAGLRRAEISALRTDQVSVVARRLVGFTRKGGGDDVTPYGDMVDVFADFLPELIPGGRESFLGPLHALVAARPSRLLLPWAEERAARKGIDDDARHLVNVPDWLNAWSRGKGRALGLKLDEVTPHMLRHSTATYLLRAGLPIEIVAELLNHSNINITRRYAKLGGGAIAAWRERQRHQVETGQDIAGFKIRV